MKTGIYYLYDSKTINAEEKNSSEHLYEMSL